MARITPAKMADLLANLLTGGSHISFIIFMKLSGKNLIKAVKERADRPMKMKELAKALSVKNPDYAAFRNEVIKLISSGQLVKLKRGRIGLAAELDVLVGKIAIIKSGKGFLIREDDIDILIPSAQLLTALDGDKVMVRLTGKTEGRDSGMVIKVMERSLRNIVGTFKRGKHFSVVDPDNPRIHRDMYIPPDETLEAQDGEKVVAILLQWEDPYLNPEAKIVERLGRPGQPGVDMLTIIKSYNLPEEFPAEVMSEAEEAAAFTEDISVGRIDLTKECIYTIDPSDAKDHDDAISVAETEKGFSLGVHIADVSYYVRPSGALDKEAFRRGNSIYLPGMVIPMLPEVLSNDVCSLRPDRKRMAHSVFVDFDKNGKVIKWKIADTIIKSQAKLSYEEVQEFFDKGELTDKIRRISSNLKTARKLASLLSQKRLEAGSLDFDLPESKIVMNDKGEVLELGHRVRLETHRLIEEFMLVANKVVALEANKKRVHFLHRVHDTPDKEKIAEFSETMKKLGYSFPVSGNMKPFQFSRFLEKVKEKPQADFINELMLRSMKKAVYQRDNIGHFGLAFTHYAHFTSPIRRYPDLLVHRLLRSFGKEGYKKKIAGQVVSLIDRVAIRCSETERVAESAEREAIKVKQVQFMARHVGDEFGGVISGVARWGFWVRLENLGAEGLVRISSIDDDYYHFDEKQYRLVGRRKHRVFRMGDRVRVGIVNVNQTTSEIELNLADTDGQKKTLTISQAKKAKGRRQQKGRKVPKLSTGKRAK